MEKACLECRKVKSIKAWGLCGHCYTRTQEGPYGRPVIGPLERFLLHAVIDRTGCWLWTGDVSRGGYGVMALGGRQEDGRRTTAAHRFSYEHFHGPIPEGMQVCHVCDVRNCVNPMHLWLGTNADNMADMKAKGRARSNKGEANKRALLTEQGVREIRERYSAGGETYRSLASEFGVSVPAISSVLHRRSWAWLD